jgi:hypothetical protein
MGIELNKDDCCGKDCKGECKINIKLGSDTKDDRTFLERLSTVLWLLFFTALIFCPYEPAIVGLFVIAVIVEGFD